MHPSCPWYNYYIYNSYITGARDMTLKLKGTKCIRPINAMHPKYVWYNYLYPVRTATIDRKSESNLHEMCCFLSQHSSVKLKPSEKGVWSSNCICNVPISFHTHAWAQLLLWKNLVEKRTSCHAAVQRSSNTLQLLPRDRDGHQKLLALNQTLSMSVFPEQWWMQDFKRGSVILLCTLKATPIFY